MATSSKSPSNAAFANVSATTGRVTTIRGLTITSGMTAGYGDNDGHYNNPPAYPGTYGGNPNWAPQRVGLMRNLPGVLNHVYTLYFIFNPNEITSSFSTNQGAIPPNYIYGQDKTGRNPSANGVPVPNLTNAQVVSWSLIFDRTYDMLYGDSPEKNRGTLRDVSALYNLMGAFENQAGVPMSTPVQVVFGRTETGQVWGFTGFISSVNITHGIFRHNMIPSRSEVDIQMTTTYVSDQVIADPGSTTGTTKSNSGASVAQLKAHGGVGQGALGPKTTAPKGKPTAGVLGSGVQP